MKLGFVFPGQGAQSVGMGKDLYEKYSEIREIYDKASEITNKNIAKLTFESTEEELAETKNTQLAILVMSLGILEVINKKADISAGLSLGEYTALIHSGIIGFEDGIKIVQKRGEIMQNEVPEGHWAMAAIIGLDDKTVEDLCNQVKSGFVVPANYNCPGQVVVSGEYEAVNILMELAKEAGAKKVVELKTGGPFHTSKLLGAAHNLKMELNKIKFNVIENKVIKNLDGTFYSKQDDMSELLSKHVINPVRFTLVAQRMLDNGVDTIVEIGPGKSLAGFIKRIDKNVNIININNVETLENWIMKNNC